MPRRRESSLHGRRLMARTTKQHRIQAVVESFEGLYEAVGEISGQEEHERFSLEARPGGTGRVIVSGYSHPRGDFELHGRLVEVVANKWDLTLEQVYTDSWNDKGTEDAAITKWSAKFVSDDRSGAHLTNGQWDLGTESGRFTATRVAALAHSVSDPGDEPDDPVPSNRHVEFGHAESEEEDEWQDEPGNYALEEPREQSHRSVGRLASHRRHAYTHEDTESEEDDELEQHDFLPREEPRTEEQRHAMDALAEIKQLEHEIEQLGKQERRAARRGGSGLLVADKLRAESKCLAKKIQSIAAEREENMRDHEQSRAAESRQRCRLRKLKDRYHQLQRDGLYSEAHQIFQEMQKIVRHPMGLVGADKDAKRVRTALRIVRQGYRNQEGDTTNVQSQQRTWREHYAHGALARLQEEARVLGKNGARFTRHTLMGKYKKLIRS